MVCLKTSFMISEQLRNSWLTHKSEWSWVVCTVLTEWSRDCGRNQEYDSWEMTAGS